jgi:hypothetical protein
MNWAGHIAHITENRSSYKVLVGNSDGRNHPGYLCVKREIISKLIVKRLM